LIVAPQTLKKFITGSGKGDKNMILLKAFQKWGKEFTDDHTCDAYGLARIGMEVYNIQHKEKDIKDYFQYEQEVLKLIKKQLKEKETE
jgi:Holliday junction resolvasome RuvABC endonuclease subunit